MEGRGKLVELVDQGTTKLIKIEKPQYTYDQVIEEYKYKLMNVNHDEAMVYKVIIEFTIIYSFSSSQKINLKVVL